MAFYWDIDKNVRINGTLTIPSNTLTVGTFSVTSAGVLNGASLTVTGAISGQTLSISQTATITGLLTLGAQATGTGHAVRADRKISTDSSLTGGGDLTADRTLGVVFAGTGTATSAARSDHTHSGYIASNTANVTLGSGFTVSGSAYIGTSTAGTPGTLYVRDTNGNNTIQIDGNSAIKASSAKLYLAGNGNATFLGTVGINKLTITDIGVVTNLNAQMINGITEPNLAKNQSSYDTAGMGVHSGMNVTATTPSPSMSVVVQPGTVYTNTGRRVNFATAVTQALQNSSATYARIDVIYVQGSSTGNNEGTITVATGTPAASPVAPSIPSDAVQLAQVRVLQNIGAITDGTSGSTNYITDTRMWRPLSMDQASSSLLIRNNVSMSGSVAIAGITTINGDVTTSKNFTMNAFGQTFKVSNGFFDVTVDENSGFTTSNGIVLDDGGGTTILPYAFIRSGYINWSFVLNPSGSVSTDPTSDSSLLQFCGGHIVGNNTGYTTTSAYMKTDSNGLFYFLNNSKDTTMALSQAGDLTVTGNLGIQNGVTISGTLTNSGARAYFNGVDGNNNFWFGTNTSATEPNSLGVGWSTDGAGKVTKVQLGTMSGSPSVLTPYTTLDDGSGNMTIGGTLKGAATGGAVRINNSNGYIEIGPQDTMYSHFYTDRAGYFFDKSITISNGTLDTYSTSDFTVKLNDTARMTILNSNGYVGIGNISPSYNLDVAGTARITGNVLVSGTLTTTQNTLDDGSGNMTVAGTLTVNGQQITPSGSNIMSHYKNTVTLASAANAVTHGIAPFSKSSDVLLVHQNGEYIQEGADWVFSADGTQVQSASGVNWNSGTIFDFVSFTTGPAPTDSGVTMAMYEATYTAATSGITNVPIGVTQYNSLTDVVYVYQEGVKLFKGTHWNLHSDNVSIDLIGFKLYAGDQIRFQVLKQVRDSYTGSIDGTYIIDASIGSGKLANTIVTNAKLDNDVKVGSLAVLMTTAKSDIVSAINEVKSASTANASNITVINNAKGQANGFASLDSNALIPVSQLPTVAKPTEIYIPLYMQAELNTNTTSSTNPYMAYAYAAGVSTSRTNLQVLHTLSNWSPNTTYQLEVYIRPYNTNTAYSTYCALWDLTTDVMVTDSQITGTGHTGAIQRSAVFSDLTPGHDYGLALWSSSASYYGHVSHVSLIAIPG